MGARNRFFTFGRQNRQRNRFFQNPPLEPLREGQPEFSREGRFAATQRNPENRRLKAANLLAAFARIADPTGPVPGLAQEFARGATASAVRSDRFVAIQEGRSPRISTFGLSAEQVGQIDRDVIQRSQFTEAQAGATERAQATIESREKIASERLTESQFQFDANKETRELGLIAQTNNIALSKAQLDLTIKRLGAITSPSARDFITERIKFFLPEVGDPVEAERLAYDSAVRAGLITQEERDAAFTLDLTGATKPTPTPTPTPSPAAEPAPKKLSLLEQIEQSESKEPIGTGFFKARQEAGRNFERKQQLQRDLVELMGGRIGFAGQFTGLSTSQVKALRGGSVEELIQLKKDLNSRQDN